MQKRRWEAVACCTPNEN